MKPILLRLAIALLILCGAAAFAVLSEPTGIPVLNYHQVNDVDNDMLTVSTADFDAQMAWLADNGYQTVTATELVDALEGKGTLPAHPVLITFDDGYMDNYQCAFPILKAHGMKAIIFLISDYIGTYPNYLTWEQILAMQAQGIEFGSHTLDHTVLTDLAPTVLDGELAGSKQALESRLGRRVDFLAYPCGFADTGIKARAKAAGYRAAFTVELGNAAPGDDLYALDRVPVFGALPHAMLRFAGRLRCPRLAAWLENLQKELIRTGHSGLAELLPAL